MKKEKQKAVAESGETKKGVKELSPWPAFIEDRQKMWDRLKAEHQEELSAKEKKPIKVTLPDGKVVDGLSWESTPYEIARTIR
jgi:threonyl-tRNA synthetase